MKLYLETFGCRANHYDTEAIRSLAVSGGHEIVSDVAEADLAVVNSCAVTGEAERDVRKAVRRAASRNPRIRTVVTGCAAGLPQSASTLRQLPNVERVVPAFERSEMAELLGVSLSADVRPQDTVRAVLRVQDGCDEHCTFCATTLARGANRSRRPEALVYEASRLAEYHAEIIITGTHIGTYGRDCGTSLGALVERLVREVPGARFRLSSLEATEVDERLMELFAGSGLVPHLHAPLQSGSDRLLKRMGRHWYCARTYAESIERLAARVPFFGLGADVIVGFPGESAVDHAQTVALIERLPFTYLHVFTYSPRPDTSAPRLPDPVASIDAQSRSGELRELGRQKGKAYRERRAGSRADCIVISSGEVREAMTEDYLTVRVAEPRPRGERFRANLRLEGDSLATV